MPISLALSSVRPYLTARELLTGFSLYEYLTSVTFTKICGRVPILAKM
jgi:hypothetical protein